MLDGRHGGGMLVDSLFHEYLPRRPSAGKWLPEAVLGLATQHVEMGDAVRRLADDFKRELGEDRTVWRVVSTGDDLTFEFNWFRPILSDPATLAALATRVSEAGGRSVVFGEFDAYSGVNVRLREPESCDLDPTVDVEYLWGDAHDREGKVVRFGMQTSSKEILELILPYRAPFDIGVDLDRARSSFNASPGATFDWADWPIYSGVVASTIGYGVRHDVLYLVGLGYHELVDFLEVTGFHRGLRLDLGSHEDGLDHLAFDVSVAYRAGIGATEFLSTSIFGVM